MRGIYWLKKCQNKCHDELFYTKKISIDFSTGKTKMNLLKDAINQSLISFMHNHIQRLMITGNFAFSGAHPDEIDASGTWYL
jgi:deoxyribodipyrimidine photolyase-related protein